MPAPASPPAPTAPSSILCPDCQRDLASAYAVLGWWALVAHADFHLIGKQPAGHRKLMQDWLCELAKTLSRPKEIR